MGLKTLAGKATGKVSKQMLIAQKHSPTMLVVAGIVGVVATAVLSGRATLKLGKVIEEGEENLKKIEVTVVNEDDKTRKASFDVKLKTAISIAKLYAPTVIVGVASVAALTGSHVIMRRRNAALTAAYAIVHKGFDDYRSRVIADQGAEKDLEYRFGNAERDIAEEEEHGIEVRTLRGLDQEAIIANESNTYARVFAPKRKDGSDNDMWSDVPNENEYLIRMVQNHANDALNSKGYIFLSDVYDMLGFKATQASRVVGWVKTPRIDPVTGQQKNDGFIDFGVWEEGMYKAKEWINGNPKAFLLDFNVDGNVLDILERM